MHFTDAGTGIMSKVWNPLSKNEQINGNNYNCMTVNSGNSDITLADWSVKEVGLENPRKKTNF